MRRLANQDGYVALITVLVVSAAAVAISLALLIIGTDSQRSIQSEQQSVQARAAANMCAEEALQQLHDNIAFSGTNTVTLGVGTCTYTVTVQTGTTRSISTTGTVGSVVRKIQTYATIGSSSISITSWQEVS